jgi:hypothetical protein
MGQRNCETAKDKKERDGFVKTRRMVEESAVV